MILDKGSIAKTRAPSFRLIVDHAALPGPPNFLGSTWCTLDPLPITQDDVAAWPYSVDILLVFSSFLNSLHWPQGTSDLGKFGISYFELLLMFEVCSGYRLQTEKTVRPHLRSRRPLVFSGFSVGIGQEIRHGCQFLHSLFRFIPCGLARFIPCQPSAHYARLSHFGWGRYGHGLSSRPRESCDHQFLTPLLNFFGYPDGAVTELFNGTLKLPLFLHSLFKEISVMVGFYSPGLFTGGWSWSWAFFPFSSYRGWLTSLSDTMDLSLQVQVSDAFSPATTLLHFLLAARRHDPGQTRRALNHLNHTAPHTTLHTPHTTHHTTRTTHHTTHNTQHTQFCP